MQVFFKLTILLFVLSTGLQGQVPEIDRLIGSELKMTFPSIYFKHNSTDYATMPYTVDSCFNYIAIHIKDINDLVIWRDSLETEKLTMQRIKKLKAGLSKHKETCNIYIESMREKQKISRRTIEAGTDSTQINYLLSLNSVFDIAKTRISPENKFRSHLYYPRPWCLDCWRNGFHIKTRKRLRKMAKHNEQSQQIPEEKSKKKSRRRLVWTGWKTGFHWSTP